MSAIGDMYLSQSWQKWPNGTCSSKLKELEWVLGTSFWTLSCLRLMRSWYFIISVFFSDLKLHCLFLSVQSTFKLPLLLVQPFIKGRDFVFTYKAGRMYCLEPLCQLVLVKLCNYQLLSPVSASCSESQGKHLARLPVESFRQPQGWSALCPLCVTASL